MEAQVAFPKYFNTMTTQFVWSILYLLTCVLFTYVKPKALQLTICQCLLFTNHRSISPGLQQPSSSSKSMIPSIGLRQASSLFLMVSSIWIYLSSVLNESHIETFNSQQASNFSAEAVDCPQIFLFFEGVIVPSRSSLCKVLTKATTASINIWEGILELTTLFLYMSCTDPDWLIDSLQDWQCTCPREKELTHLRITRELVHPVTRFGRRPPLVHKDPSLSLFFEKLTQGCNRNFGQKIMFNAVPSRIVIKALLPRSFEICLTSRKACGGSKHYSE